MAIATDDSGRSFVREVDEAYRRDRLAHFWRRYGRWLLIGLILLLAAVGAFVFWREQQAREAAARGAAFTAALNKLQVGNDAAKGELARLASAEEPGYRALARLGLAADALRRNDRAAAAAQYRELASDRVLAPPFRNLATLELVRLEFDTMKLSQIEQRLRPLAQAGSPWLGPAGELLALAYLRDGQRDRAAPLLKAVAEDVNQDRGLRLRASELAATLGMRTQPVEMPGAGVTAAAAGTR